MGGKSGGCCCTSCYTSFGCETADRDQNNPNGFCCKCLPSRICATLYVDDSSSQCFVGSGVPVDSTQLSLDCTYKDYIGSLACSGENIDISLSFSLDGSGCYTRFQSNCLSHSGDSAVMYQMGGTNQSIDIRKSGCLNFHDDASSAFNFPVGLSGCLSTASNDSYIQFTKGDYTYLPYYEAEPSSESLCIYSKSCITYESGVVGEIGYISETNTLCSVSGSWTTSFNDGTTAEISGYGDPTYLELANTSLGTPTLKNQLANCPPMYAEWSSWVDNHEDISISILGDRRKKCTDCSCWCRCLCVTYTEEAANGMLTLNRGLMCGENDWVTWSGWTGELNDVYSTGIFEVPDITLECVEPCDGTTTYTRAQHRGETDFIACPDIDISFTVPIGVGYSGYTLDAECAKCVDCSLEPSVADLGCCAGSGIPTTLTATIEDAGDCGCADGATGTLFFNHAVNSAFQYWTGAIENVCGVGDVSVKLTCGGDFCGGGDACTSWELEVGGSCTGLECAQTGCDCDVIELLFNAVGVGCAVCDDPVIADFNIRITE